MDMSTLDCEKERIVVQIEPPADVIERARTQARGGETTEAHLLDQYVFEYDWIGVNVEK